MDTTNVQDPDRGDGLDELRRRRLEADHALGFHRDWPMKDCPACQTGTRPRDTFAVSALRAARRERNAA